MQCRHLPHYSYLSVSFAVNSENTKHLWKWAILFRIIGNRGQHFLNLSYCYQFQNLPKDQKNIIWIFLIAIYDSNPQWCICIIFCNYKWLKLEMSSFCKGLDAWHGRPAAHEAVQGQVMKTGLLPWSPITKWGSEGLPAHSTAWGLTVAASILTIWLRQYVSAPILHLKAQAQRYEMIQPSSQCIETKQNWEQACQLPCNSSSVALHGPTSRLTRSHHLMCLCQQFKKSTQTTLLQEKRNTQKNKILLWFYLWYTLKFRGLSLIFVKRHFVLVAFPFWGEAVWPH